MHTVASRLVDMITPADVNRMRQRARATIESAQKLARSDAQSKSSRDQSSSENGGNNSAHIEIAFSSHYSSGYFMEDEEYHAEYDLELNTGTTTSRFTSISSSIVPLFSTSSQIPSPHVVHSKSDEGNKDSETNDRNNRNNQNDRNALNNPATAERDFSEIGTALRGNASVKQALEKLSEELQLRTRNVPTPAIMAKRREDAPTSFASLDNRDLPVVREYSAGGLVFDEHDRVAIIARHSRSGHLEWCLPKGHIEKGETPDQTAVREIHEETGILGEVTDSIATIDYWFTGDSQRIHKLVHHYALRMVGGYLTVEGDPDHEAEDATWVKFDDLTDVLSYPNERRIVWLYAKKHRKES